MSPLLQGWIQVGTICIALVGALVYQIHYFDRRLDDLRSEINHRFEDLIRYIDARFGRIEGRLD
jgi:hypothetical protein